MDKDSQHVAEAIGCVGLMLVAAYFVVHGISNFWVWLMFGIGLIGVL